MEASRPRFIMVFGPDSGRVADAAIGGFSGAIFSAAAVRVFDRMVTELVDRGIYDDSMGFGRKATEPGQIR